MRTLRTIRIGQFLLGAMLLAPAAHGAQRTAEMPRLENAQLETRPVAGSLEATLRDLAGKAKSRGGSATASIKLPASAASVGAIIMTARAAAPAT